MRSEGGEDVGKDGGDNGMTEVGPTKCDTCGKTMPEEMMERKSWMIFCIWGERPMDLCSYACLRAKIEFFVTGN